MPARGKNGKFVSNNHANHRFGGLIDPIAANQLAGLYDNALLSRKDWLFSKFLDPRRNINAECGYPETANLLDARIYKQLYDREPVASRVVQVLPKESWQQSPQLYEEGSANTQTEFETAWAELPKKLRGTSWFADEVGSPIWEMLQRADELSGIGSFGIILLGLDDGLDLSLPAAEVDELGRFPETPAAGRGLLYLRVFDESLLQISRYETRRDSPRYNQPVEYLVTMADPADSKGGMGVANTTLTVHWTRVVHIAEVMGSSSEVFAIPRMRPVYNRIYDLIKLYGGSAEMYWRGAFTGLSFETHPALGGDVSIDPDALREQIENYENGLQRYLAIAGATVKSLAPQVSDPTAQINAQIDSICIQLGMPKRIFVGSERGNLASSQDDKTWNDRLAFRQNNYITPRIIVPFVDRLISLGVLPIPPAGYHVDWPDLGALTAMEKADIGLKKTQALAAYLSAGGVALMGPEDFLTYHLGFDEAEAQDIVADADKFQTEAEDSLLMEKAAPPAPPTFGPDGEPIQPGEDAGSSSTADDGEKSKGIAKKSPVGKSPIEKG